MQKTVSKSSSILLDSSRSLGLLSMFRNGKTCIIAKFNRSDLVIHSHFGEGKLVFAPDKNPLRSLEVSIFQKIYWCRLVTYSCRLFLPLNLLKT